MITDVESLLRNHCCGIRAVESLLWNHCCGIIAVESLLWNHCCGILAVKSLLWNHCCGIIAVLWNQCCGIIAVESLLRAVSEVGAAGLGWPGWQAGLRQVRFNFDCENLGFLTKVPLKCKFY